MTYRGRRLGRRPGRHRASAGIALAGLALAVAGCGHVLPLGLSAIPAPSHLASAIILQPAVIVPSRSAVIPSGSPAAPATPPTASCPAGYAALPAGDEPPGSAGCYRKLGPPATFTTAAVTVFHQPRGPQGQPAQYALRITLPAAGAATLTAITANAANAAGTREQLAIIVADQTWSAFVTLQPLTNGEFVIPAQSLNQALQLQRILLQTA